jgi:tetratricopeptide (TPR) repeat protein
VLPRLQKLLIASYNTRNIQLFDREAGMNGIAQNVIASCIVIGMLLCLSACGLSTAQGDFDKGMAFFNQGNYDAAIPHLQKAIEQDSGFVDAYLYLGRSYLNTRQWAKSLAPLRTAYRLSPDRTKGMIQDLIMDAILGAASQGIKLDTEK